MTPYIAFKIKGIHGISVSAEQHSFSPENSDVIKAVELLLSDMDIVGTKIYFAENILIDESLIASTKKSIELFIVNIIGELDASVHGLEFSVEDVYNPNLPPNDGPIEIHSTIGISCSVTAISIYKISRFQELFSTIPDSADQEDAYFVFSNIMKIDNMAIRYLMQYEFLMSLVSPNRKQKDITDYIRDTYNPTLKFDTIGFHTTRRVGKTFDEDDLTYYRNILAHNDFSFVPNNFEKVIATMSKGLNRVIFFCLKRMK